MDIKDHVYRKLLAIQRIYRLVSSPKFDAAYKVASEEEKSIINSCIDSLDRTGLYVVMKRLLDRDLENWNITELRELGYALSVPNYQYKTKDTLIEAIMKKKMKE